MTKQDKRYIAAGIVGTIGFLVCLSAVGQAEYDGIFVEDFALRSVIGILLMFAAVPLSGDIDGKKKTAERRQSQQRQNK